MITAICEMYDQDRCIRDIRLIENTKDAIQKYEEDMSDIMGWIGFRVYFFDTEYSEVDYCSEHDVYEFMRVNAHLEIDV